MVALLCMVAVHGCWLRCMVAVHGCVAVPCMVAFLLWVTDPVPPSVPASGSCSPLPQILLRDPDPVPPSPVPAAGSCSRSPFLFHTHTHIHIALRCSVVQCNGAMLLTQRGKPFAKLCMVRYHFAPNRGKPFGSSRFLAIPKFAKLAKLAKSTKSAKFAQRAQLTKFTQLAQLAKFVQLAQLAKFASPGAGKCACRPERGAE